MNQCVICKQPALGLQCLPCQTGKTGKPKQPTERKARPTVQASASVDGGALVVTLPLPTQALHPNGRAHFFEEARARAAYRSLTASVVRIARFAPLWDRATVLATFYFRDAKRRDSDNALASLKSGFDGLQDAGVVVNDSGLTHLPPVLSLDRLRPRVELRVTQAMEKAA